jgi:hypothetical protein
MELLLAFIYLDVRTNDFITSAISFDLSISMRSGSSKFTWSIKNSPTDLQNHAIRPQIDPINIKHAHIVFDIPDIYGAHFFFQGVAFPGFPLRSRARQRIRQ